ARAGEHDLLPAKLVADHPARQHDGSERQGVAADHPLELRDRRLQVGLQAAKPDGDDRVIEERQEEQQAERGEPDGACAAAPVDCTAGPYGAQLAELHAAGAVIVKPALLASVSRLQKTSSPTFHVPSCRTELPDAPVATVVPMADRSYFTVALVDE